jgi:hypothetical protein
MAKRYQREVIRIRISIVDRCFGHCVLLRYTDSDYLPLVSFVYCVVCSSIYGFWLPPFGIFWPLYCLFFDIRILITSLWYLLAIVLSVLLQNNIHKTKDRVTRTPLKTGDELRCSGTVSSTCSTSSRVNLVTNPVISHERGKDREVFTTSGTYPWSFVISLQSTVLCIHISCLVYVRTEKLWSNKKVISSLAQIKYNTYRLNVIWFHDVIGIRWHRKF